MGGNQDMLEHVSYSTVLFLCWVHSVQKLFMSILQMDALFFQNANYLARWLHIWINLSTKQRRVVAGRPKIGNDHERHLYQYDLQIVFISLFLRVLNVSDGNISKCLGV